MINYKLKKGLDLLFDKGIVAVAKASLRQWAISVSRVSINLLDEFKFVLLPCNPAELKYAGGSKLTINWFILGVPVGSGGHFNIFRTIMYLEQLGHVCRIYVVGDSYSNESFFNGLIQQHYLPIKARVIVLRGEMAACDALVATCWSSAYYARNHANTAQKFYFVQDLEDQFYAQGSLAEFVRETYRFGFVGLTAGSWISDTLTSTYGMQCFPSGFSYDKNNYFEKKTTKSGKSPKVLFYARPETERRGFELGMLALSIVAKTHPHVEFVLVGMKEKNLITPFKVTYPGVLAVDELPNLYQECSLALVISLTNLSLLPLEIMASGCALVSNEGANVRWLLNDDVATIVPNHPEAIASAIVSLLDDPDLLERKVCLGQEFALSTDWQREVKKVETAMLNVLKKA